MTEAMPLSRKRSRQSEQHCYSGGGDGDLDDENDRLLRASTTDTTCSGAATAPGREGATGLPRHLATSGTTAAGVAAVTAGEETAGNNIRADGGDSSSSSKQSSSSSACCRLRKGMVILKSFLCVEEQRHLAVRAS